MAYYHRKSHTGWRRRRTGYRPRARHWRRNRRRQHYRGRRRHWYSGTPRVAVRQTLPQRRKWIHVRGWEPLGNVCTQTTAKMRASPYCDLERGGDCTTQGQWQGTWGYHYHTMQNLLLRAKARWCRFSGDWESHDYMKFCGGWLYIPQNQDLSFIFNVDTYWLATHLSKDNPSSGPAKTAEETWVHPGYMLHAPHSHLILSRRLSHHAKFYKIKIKVPASWESYTPIQGSIDWILWFWYWTWWDPERTFFNPCEDETGSSCNANPWWGKSDDWVDRSKYNPLCNGGGNCWGPFLPSKQCSGNSSSFWFFYKLKFKVGGESIWAPVPRIPSEQGYIPSAPSKGSSGKIQPHPGNIGRYPRPWTPADIFPCEISDGFFINDEAMERIIGGDTTGEPPIKRRKLERSLRRRRPFKHLPDQLRRLLRCVFRRKGLIPRTMPRPSQHIP